MGLFSFCLVFEFFRNFNFMGKKKHAQFFLFWWIELTLTRSPAQPPTRLSRLRAHVPYDIDEVVEQLLDPRIDNFYLMRLYDYKRYHRPRCIDGWFPWSNSFIKSIKFSILHERGSWVTCVSHLTRSSTWDHYPTSCCFAHTFRVLLMISCRVLITFI